MENRKLNILFIGTEYESKRKSILNNYGGQASYLQNIAHLIRKENHKVSVYVISNKIFNYNENGIKIRYFGFKLKIPYLNRISDFINYISLSFHLNFAIYNENKRKKFDVIQYPSFLNFGVFLFLPKYSKKICRISGVTKIWRKCNKQDINLLHSLSDYLEKKRVQIADKVYAPSKIISKNASLVYSKKIHTINSPFIKINTNKFKNIKKLTKEKPILFVGTLNRVKGFDLLVDAFLKIFQEYKDVSLIISGRNETFENKINSISYLFRKCNKYKSRIRYMGVLPKTKIFNLYNIAEAVVIPSRLDNYPNVMIESILFKKPIIGFLNSSLEEVIRDKENGFLAKNKNSINLYNKLEEFLQINKKKRKNLDKNITKLYNKLIDVNYTKKIIDFYSVN